MRHGSFLLLCLIFSLLLPSVFLESSAVSMEMAYAQTVSGGNSVSSGDVAGQKTAGELFQGKGWK